jgi:hypothetical protein
MPCHILEWRIVLPNRVYYSVTFPGIPILQTFTVSDPRANVDIFRVCRKPGARIGGSAAYAGDFKQWLLKSWMLQPKLSNSIKIALSAI